MRAPYIQDEKTWKQDFAFSVTVTVRFSETDMNGHLNNTVPFTYFEHARIEFFKSIGLMQDWMNPKGKTMPVVADMQCDYVKQVFFDETLWIGVKVNRIGTSSVDVHYWAKNEAGETCLTGRGTMVQLSRATGKGHPWTEAEKELLRRTTGASV